MPEMTRDELVQFVAAIPGLTSHLWHPIGDDGEPEPHPAVVIHDDEEVARRGAEAIFERFAVIPLDGVKRTDDPSGVDFETPSDALVRARGTVVSTYASYHNLARGDDPTTYAAAVILATREARKVADRG